MLVVVKVVVVVFALAAVVTAAAAAAAEIVHEINYILALSACESECVCVCLPLVLKANLIKTISARLSVFLPACALMNANNHTVLDNDQLFLCLSLTASV